MEVLLFFWRLKGRIHFLTYSSFCRLPAFFGLWYLVPSSKPTGECLQLWFLCLPVSHLKEFLEYIGLTRIIQDYVQILKSIISSLNFIYNFNLSCNITYAHILGTGMWTFLEDQYSVYYNIFCQIICKYFICFDAIVSGITF